MMLSYGAALGLMFLTIPFLALAVAYHTLIRIRQREIGTLRRRNVVLGLCTSLLSLWLLLLVLELFFKAFVIQSDAFGHTLAAKRWFERYWGPTNSFGFRDQEFDTRILASSRTLFVIGDSFVAGLGVNDPEDRFSNHLRRWMGSEWSVLNFGRNGWNTRHEIEALRSFPIHPDVIVWSYYLNDIAGAAAEHGHNKYIDLSISPSWVSALVENSYFVNFVYWRWFRVLSRLEGGPFWEAIQADFDNKAIWNTHRQELLGVVDYIRHQHIALLVVVFPSLTDIIGSQKLTAQVADTFRIAGAPVIDLSDYLVGRDPRSLIVNSVDAHPNVDLHLEVAQIIYTHLRKLGYD